LKTGGAILSGMTNPVVYLFDPEDIKKDGILKAVRKLPYSDLKDLSEEAKKEIIDRKLAFEFSHTLQDLIGGQLESGLSLEGFYEDNYENNDSEPLSKLMPLFFATRSIKQK
jgi:hypothetical protein